MRRDATEWQKSYPNLLVVSRDGSISYRSVIEQADSGIEQISAHIRQKGYDGADATIRMFVTRERKRRRETALNGKRDKKTEQK